VKKTMMASALACAVLAVPGLALADDTSSHDAMAKSPMTATMLCRPAMANERGTAMMMANKTALVCKTVDPAMMAAMKKKAGLDAPGALSAEQADAAWRAFVESVVTIPAAPGGG